MDDKKEIPKRKELRLKQYDYSAKGAYFITICIEERKRILSDIVKPVGVGALDGLAAASVTLGIRKPFRLPFNADILITLSETVKIMKNI